MKKIWIVMLAVVLTGCATATWKKSQPIEYVDNGRKFAAMVPEGWMYFSDANVFVSTKDGNILDGIGVSRIRFGDKLPNVKKQFKQGMLPDEIADIEIDRYQSNPDMQKFELKSNDPVNINGKDAFRLSYRYQTSSGLLKKGVHYGFIHDGFVYSIIYQAAEQHYYDANEQAFEIFMKTFRVL